MAGLGFSGAVLVASGDKVLMRNGYGWSDETRRIPITAETVFDIGSITKVFTTVAIMQMEAQGKIVTPAKLELLKHGEKRNPVIDPRGYRSFVMNSERAFHEELRHQRQSALQRRAANKSLDRSDGACLASKLALTVRF